MRMPTGARMLRQDPVECLFQFICSSNNHISRIGGMVERLCAAYGTPLIPSDPAAEHELLCLSMRAQGGGEGVQSLQGRQQEHAQQGRQGQQQLEQGQLEQGAQLQELLSVEHLHPGQGGTGATGWVPQGLAFTTPVKADLSGGCSQGPGASPAQASEPRPPPLGRPRGPTAARADSGGEAGKGRFSLSAAALAGLAAPAAPAAAAAAGLAATAGRGAGLQAGEQGKGYYAFPTLPQLACAEEAELRAAGFGWVLPLASLIACPVGWAGLRLGGQRGRLLPGRRRHKCCAVLHRAMPCQAASDAHYASALAGRRVEFGGWLRLQAHAGRWVCCKSMSWGLQQGSSSNYM